MLFLIVLNKDITKFKTEKPVICACSGGIDSTTLLHVMQKEGFNIHVLIVNHNLRKNSTQEAKEVRENAIKIGAKQVQILTWEHEKLTTGIEEKARKARYNLIFEYALKHNITDIFLGHHLGDKIENFFLKLGTGSFENLKMEKDFRWNGHCFRLIRPFILLTKKEITYYSSQYNLKFSQDDTNFENTFKRNRLRKALPLALRHLELLENSILKAFSSFERSEKIIIKRIDNIFETIILFDGNFAFFKVSRQEIGQISKEEMMLCLKRIIFYFSEKTDFRAKELETACEKIYHNPNFTINFVEIFESKGFVYFVKEKKWINNEIKFGIWDLRFKISGLPENAIIKPIDFKLEKAILPAKIIKTLPAIYEAKGKELLAIPNFKIYNDCKSKIHFEVNFFKHQ